MAATYEPISTYTFSSAAASYTFSGIPSTYDDLAIVMTETTSSGSNENGITFNGDTSTSNYGQIGLYARANNTSAANWFVDNEGKIRFGGSVENVTHRFEIVNYRSSYWKYVLVDAYGIGSGQNQAWHLAGCWKSTDAITSITFNTYGGAYGYLFRTGSQITLYGIKRA